MNQRVTRLALVLIALFVAGAALGPTNEHAQPRGVVEASSVTRLGPNLIVVTDSDPGAYYTVPVRDNNAKVIPIKAASIRRHTFVAGGLASDVEGVDVLPDGRIVALSERRHALVGDGGLVAEYPDFLGEVGGIGLEGLSARAAARGSAALQRVSADGHRVGPSPDLTQATPELGRRNWEGLGWFEDGQRLVLVHDQSWIGDAVALAIPLDTWPSESPR